MYLKKSYLRMARPELAFAAALLILALTLLYRALRPETPASLAIDWQAPAPAALDLGDPQLIALLQERLRANPDDAGSYALLGLALLQRVRETADAGLYEQAGSAFDEALARDPQQIEALIGQGSLALARHQFVEALEWGERARLVNPFRAQVYGILGDAYVELGRYDEAFAAIQKMVDTRPELSSYSRASYMRELQGDTAGAIILMQRAVASGNPRSENTHWAQVQLGNLYFNSGNLAQAERSYTDALTLRPGYAYAEAGLAQVRAARGDLEGAIALYRPLVERLPLAEFAITLGRLYERAGRVAEAQAQYELVRAIQQLNSGAGMDVDLELALFEADYGDPAVAVRLAQAAYARRPSIHAADGLAWALYRQGSYAEARRYSQEALRLGTRDALLHLHAGMISRALGDESAARAYLADALAINPCFDWHPCDW